ncbi:MAG TPA: DUF2924 domain-containing protein [Bryobacteraceae bacterium]|jgi:hypothetical protein|nr:DUF2924 domain-containing protein [Bryobacteraceae bacterium]
MKTAENRIIDLDAELAALERMNVRKLRQRHLDLFGETPHSFHRQFLVRQIAWRLQAKLEGGLDEETRQYAIAIARDCAHAARIEQNALRRQNGISPEARAAGKIHSHRDTRLPMPGSLLVREIEGETHVVKILRDGFDYGGRVFRSLSAIAQEITGTKWNGFRFFGLAKEEGCATRTGNQRK